MINDSIINEIEKLRHYTDTRLKDVQSTKIPCLYTLDYQIEKKYIYNNEVNNFNLIKRLIIKIKNLPLSNTAKDKNRFIDNMETIVKLGLIQPFILFLDGEFVKWSDMTIVYDKYTYIIVNTEKAYPNCECIVFPYNVIYLENVQYVPNDDSFQFNSNGLLATLDDTEVTRIKIKDNRYITYYSNYMIPDKKTKIKINKSYKISKNNLIFFKNGKLYTDNKYEQYPLNNFIIDDGKYNEYEIIYKFFYYIFGNKSKDNILLVKNEQYIESTVSSNEGVPVFISELSRAFDFQYDKKRAYTQNVLQSLDYIFSYNSSLLNNLYRNTANIEFFEYNGQRINAIKKSDGYVYMSRLIKNGKEGYPIIFVNGKLYKYYHFIKYSGSTFSFPIIDINNDDRIEIVIFQNVDNRIIKTFIPSYESDNFIIDPSIDIAYLKIFSNDTPNAEFNVPHSSTLKYEVKFESSIIDNNNFTIKLNDSYYYDRELYFSSLRQFRYFYMINKKDNNIKVRLPEEFSYCNDKNRYIVFVNGIKLNQDDYIITLINENRPFNEHSIYTNTPMKINDKIDVFYVPNRMEEISIIPVLPIEGTVYMDRTKLSYNFSKDLYMIFVNGSKVRKSEIMDIDSSKMKILNSIKSINNVCVVKYIEDDEILSKIFKQIDSLTMINNIIPREDLEKLYDRGIISDIDLDTDANQIDIKYVIKQVIKDYWLKTTTVSDKDVLLYDFDKTIKELTDADGNILYDHYS